MATSMLEIQTSIFEKLEDSSSLDSLVTGIFDDVPDDQPFPYISISEVSENNFNTFDRDGKESVFTISIWSRYEGFKECYEILEVVNDLLNYQELSVNNYTTVYIRSDGTQVLKDPDGLTRHINVDFRVIVQEV